MSEIHIDHEAAIQTAQQYNDPDCPGEIDNLSRAYLDLHEQLAAERARVDALCDVIYDANGIAYPFENMQDKMTTILNGAESEGT